MRSRLDLYGPRPDPTAAEGPDPYGDPDPDWLRIDWREHLGEVVVPAAASAVPGGEAAQAGGTLVRFAELGPPRDRQASRAILLVHGLAGWTRSTWATAWSSATRWAASSPPRR